MHITSLFYAWMVLIFLITFLTVSATLETWIEYII